MQNVKGSELFFSYVLENGLVFHDYTNHVIYSVEVSQTYRQGDQGIECLCRIRNRWFRASPEEKVRQAILGFLIDNKGYPAGRISVEAEIVRSPKVKRVDIAVHDEGGRIVMLVECKRPQVAIDSSTLNQALSYLRELEAPFIFLSNGQSHHVFQLDMDSRQLVAMDSFPSYDELTAHA